MRLVVTLSAMKHILALLALTIATVPSFGQDVHINVAKDLDSSGMEPIYIQEIKLWKTLQAGDRGAFKANLLPNFINVTDTLQNRDQLVNSFKHCEVGPLNLQNHTTRALGVDAAVISYRLHIEMTCGKQSVIVDSNATTTWIRQKDNHWLAILHTESPIKPTS
jgi:hypothetical protein